jgi:hypothetical protein
MENKISLFESLNYIADNAEKYAKLKAHVTYMTEKRKSIKASLMRKSLAKTESAKESDAYAHPDYLHHLEEMAEAIAEYETVKTLMMLHELKAESWRSLEASNRALDRVAR